MKKDGFGGNWEHARSPANEWGGKLAGNSMDKAHSSGKEWWAQLTGDSMDKVRSQRSKFVGLIQEKYGYTRERAEQEFDRHMAEL